MVSSHGVRPRFAVIGVTAMIFYATVWSTSGQLVAAWIYGAGLVATLSISFLYNLYPVSKRKWFLRRFDHSSIYILIAATYTPFLRRSWDDPYLFGTADRHLVDRRCRRLDQMRLSWPLRQAGDTALPRHGLERRFRRSVRFCRS